MSNHVNFQTEWNIGWEYFAAKNLDQAKIHFERAHYYSVFSVKSHFLAHYAKWYIAKTEKKYSHMALHVFLMMLAPISWFAYFFHKIKLFLPMHFDLKQAFDKEMELAETSYHIRDFDTALRHLGRAHILGSHFCFPHFRTHFRMLKIEWKRHVCKGMIIQISRTIGALGTRFLVHFFGVTGNPGWSSYPIGTRLPIAEDLKMLLNKQDLKTS